MEITSDFQKLGCIAAFDTETAMAPKAFEGRDCVRLLQAYSTSHEFWYDLKTFTDADWAELKTCLENPGLTLIFQNAGFDRAPTFSTARPTDDDVECRLCEGWQKICSMTSIVDPCPLCDRVMELRR